jgi:hypothetical protein
MVFVSGGEAGPLSGKVIESEHCKVQVPHAEARRLLPPIYLLKSYRYITYEKLTRNNKKR